MDIPRIIISGLSGGAGKTMVSLGLARALTRFGLRVKTFKKGPDYIDAAWLALAARSVQANLDPFFLPAPALRFLFRQGAAGHDISLIEGNRGLFDGLDLSGSCSTAELSRILLAPVLLVIDCTKMTRTAAALVKGCLQFEKGLHIGGAILNRTGNPRHQSMVRRAVEELAGVPVFGVLPRRSPPFIMERHMGLAGLDEYAQADNNLDALANFMADHADLEEISRLAATAPALPPDEACPSPADSPHTPCPEYGATLCAVQETTPAPYFPSAHGASPAAKPRAQTGSPVRSGKSGPSPHPESEREECRPCIGYVRDAAFWFYYEENLAALRAAGATLVPLSLLEGKNRRASRTDENIQEANAWDRLDGLYIGGGQPELHAEALAANLFCREKVASLSRSGLPIYAECGGFMYLAEELRMNDAAFSMAGVFACSVELHSRPQGLGYVEAEVMAPNPFHPHGTRFRGHEFHFSRCVPRHGSVERKPCQAASGADSQISHAYILRLHKGCGMCSSPDQKGFDGLLFRNTFAAYTHVFAPALPHWARNFTSLCAEWKRDSQRT
ncbi:MAG: cobyrinate a,c-diamide synthase [Desulfovibrio sp.]|jgi:cobyrinic acid a,c-diamide synthase|nr:cobyrinate a,c-diamide synthase [Desulfovibrio sp.]